jgi:glycosyltransferase involved in cell wall biosynthesis
MFGYLPPPVFGPSVSYQALMRSEFARHFEVTFINLSVVNSVHELEVFRIGKLLKFAGFAGRELGHLLRRRFDFCCYPISLSKNAFLKDALLLQLARAFAVPTVIYAQGTGLGAFREKLSPRMQGLFDATIRNAAGAIVMAEALRSDFDGLLPADRVFVVWHGIEPAGWPFPDRKNRASLTMLSLGLLRREKGTFDLLKAMPLVLAKRPEIKLVLAGQWWRPDQQSDAEIFIRENNLAGSVKFVGPVAGATKWQQLCDADIFVFPSHTRAEAFGMVLLEAMQAGLPIVATRGGARSEMIADGVNGLLAADQDPADLAAKILQLADDDALRERMAQANREKFAREFTHEQYGRRMIGAFETLAARGRQRTTR